MTTTRRGRLLKDLEPGELIMALDLWRDETGTEPSGARDQAAVGYLKGATSAQVCRLAEYVGARAVLIPKTLTLKQAVAAHKQGSLSAGDLPAFTGFADVLARRRMFLAGEDAPNGAGNAVRVRWPVVAFDLVLLTFILDRTVSGPGKYLVPLAGVLKDYPTLWPREAECAGK